MTELLRRVIAEIEKLPEAEQDAIATRLLAELKNENAAAWDQQFEADVAAGKLDALAEKALQHLREEHGTDL